MRFPRINRVITFPFRYLVLIAVSMLFSVLLYIANSEASIYDIHNPNWVISMAALILLSPLFNGVFIILVHAYQNRRPVTMHAAISRTLSLYPRLVAAEFLINLIVMAGMFMFILPGIYIGLRLIFYKQAILLSGHSVTRAAKESLYRIPGLRAALPLLLFLAPFYAFALLISYGIDLLSLGSAGVIIAILVSGLTFAWTNTLITLSYRPEPSKNTEQPSNV